MGKVNIADLKDGMIVEEPVYTPNGVILLNRGVKLTQKNIFVLKSWGITSIQINGIDISTAKQVSVSLSDIIKQDNYGAEMNRQTKDVGSNIVMKEILRIAKKQADKAMTQDTGRNIKLIEN